MNILVALSQIDNGESENHGAETSEPTNETSVCEKWFVNHDFIIFRNNHAAQIKINKEESIYHGSETSGPNNKTPWCENNIKIRFFNFGSISKLNQQ